MCSHPQGIPRIVLASSFVPSVSRQNSLILSQFPHIIQGTILIQSHTAGHSQRGNPILRSRSVCSFPSDRSGHTDFLIFFFRSRLLQPPGLQLFYLESSFVIQHITHSLRRQGNPHAILGGSRFHSDFRTCGQSLAFTVAQRKILC